MAERKVFSGAAPVEKGTVTVFDSDTNSFVVLRGKDYEDHMLKIEELNKEKLEMTSIIEESDLKIKKYHSDIFYKQLTEFISDKSYRDKYINVDINDNHYIIEIFRFKTKDKSLFSSESSKSGVLLIDPLSGDIKDASDVYVDYTHVAKILKAPKGDVKYKEGDCVLLNPFDIVGKAKNPEFALYEQFQHSLGYTPVIPENLQENIPAIQARYLEYQFVLPEDYNIGTQNIVTFLVPEFKIKAKYNI